MCDEITVGPSAEAIDAVANTGVAAHISAASEGGCRFDPNLTSAQRRAIENAIWLCGTHSILVDRDDVTYTVEGLRELKRDHEDRIKAEHALGDGSRAAVKGDVALLEGLARDVIEWPTTLDGKHHLERPELGQTLAAIDDATPKTVAILGGPGLGKSALLAEVASNQRQAGKLVLGFRCEGVPKRVGSVAELSAWVGLTESIDVVLRRIAQRRVVVLVIDQLDALSDLVDLETERLDAILALLRKLRGVENLQVVVGCRRFDFEHDTRLRGLDAVGIELSVPPWETIAEVLKSRELDPSGFPLALQALLAVPQQLKVFLALASRGASQPISYQGMLEQLWAERIAGDPQRVALVGRIVRVLTDDEALSAPCSIADGHVEVLDALEREGVLRRDAARTSVSFAHQTLFEFARARTFAESNSLAAHVKTRRDGIFVRPTLWTALAYLRGARRDRYLNELQTLWNDSELPLHLRILLVEFLGQLADPSDDEAMWMLSAARDARLRSTALVAAAGSKEWFRHLDLAGILDDATRNNLEGSVGHFLAGASSFARERVLDLVDSVVGTEAGDALAVRVLTASDAWDDRAVLLAVRITSASAPTAFALDVLVRSASHHHASRGAPIVAAALSRAHRKNRSRDNDDSFEVASTIFELEALAAEAPMTFLQALLPVFEDAVRGHARMDQRLTYQGDGLLDARADAPNPSSFVAALRAASEGAAREVPDEFVAFVGKVQESPLMATHTLVALGLAKLPPTHVTHAVTYLTGDARRMRIAGFGDSDTTTRTLLQAVSQTVDGPEVARIEAMAMTSSIFDELQPDTAEGRRACQQYNRRHRLRLLRCLPIAMLSPDGRRLLDQEGRVFADAEDPDAEISGGGIGSPVSMKEMLRASNDEILNLFSELTDDTGFDHPRRDLEGGSVQASREFGEFAKKEPDRAIAIIRRMKPNLQENPVAHALAALGEIKDVRFEPLVLEVDRRGFVSEELRWQVCYAVAKWAQEHCGASDELCAMLRRWLEEATPAVERVEEPEQKGPLLYGWVGGGSTPRGGYPAMHALFCGLVLRKPSAIDPWLEALEGRLTNGSSSREWEGLAYDLRNLRLAPSRERAIRFISDLMRKHPNLLATKSGAHLVASSASWVPVEIVRGWVETQEVAASPVARQASGELLVLLWSLDASSSALARIDALEAGVGDEMVSLGVSYAMANVWREQKTRLRSTSWIVGRLEKAGDEEREGLLKLFRSEAELRADAFTVAVLEALIRCPDALLSVPPILYEQLGDLLPSQGALVVRLVHTALDACKTRGTDPSSTLGRASVELVSVALTMQRTRHLRAEGMRLFERLLELGFYGVREALFEIDARPVARGPAPILRRSRRRR